MIYQSQENMNLNQDIIKEIIIVSASYPSPEQPYLGIFVKNIASGWKQLGAKVVVISPQPILGKGKLIQPLLSKTEDDVTVIRPFLPNISKIFVWNRRLQHLIQELIFSAACSWGLRYFSSPPTFVYCHFLSTVQGAHRVAEAFNAPLFVGCGESNIEYGVDKLSLKSKNIIAESTSGLISNSPVISHHLQLSGIVKKTPILTIPNRADPKRFFPVDLLKARFKKGINPAAFVIIYVGQFIERKGYKQLLDALGLLPDMKVVLIGKGNAPPLSEQIIFSGCVDHKELPQWLGCANVFVLPTRGEGCSNAISEAMAMGIPIVSSDVPEVRCQVFPTSSILVNPNSPDEIARAIKVIQSQYTEYRLKAVANAETISKESRAEVIFNWIEKRIDKQ